MCGCNGGAGCKWGQSASRATAAPPAPGHCYATLYPKYMLEGGICVFCRLGGKPTETRNEDRVVCCCRRATEGPAKCESTSHTKPFCSNVFWLHRMSKDTYQALAESAMKCDEYISDMVVRNGEAKLGFCFECAGTNVDTYYGQLAPANAASRKRRKAAATADAVEAPTTMPARGENI